MYIILYHATEKQWYQFHSVIESITAMNTDQVLPALAEIENRVEKENLFAAGYLTYEAAPAFDPHYKVHSGSPLPCLRFGLFREPERLDTLPFTGDNEYSLTSWRYDIDQREYQAAISRIKSEIRQGNTYQVNYTFPLYAQFKGDHRSLFYHMALSQDSGYAALIEDGPYVICSASPELFFSLNGNVLVSKPMKGTARRGLTTPDDMNARRQLYNSEKDRAENIMITDMIRNDMGHIAEYGSVTVPAMFETERYPTVWQMTSTVRAQTRASITDIFRALFPCSSITGAPKVSTMGIIHELEKGPRGIYTGSIGYLAPNRQAQFNVAIRTMEMDLKTGQAAYHVGSGVVWDSDPQAEYHECLLKAKVVRNKHVPFQLLETMLWEPGSGYFLPDLHLARLLNSALYFDYKADPVLIKAQLDEQAAALTAPTRVRLLLDVDGSMEIQCYPLEPGTGEPVIVHLANGPVHSSTVWLYHKTTRREVYDNQLDKHSMHDDVILYNEYDDITEGCLHNVVVKIDDKLCTPPVSSGLLAGTFREHLLKQGEITERTISIEEFVQAEEIWLINSVRKWRRVDQVEWGG